MGRSGCNLQEASNPSLTCSCSTVPPNWRRTGAVVAAERMMTPMTQEPFAGLHECQHAGGVVNFHSLEVRRCLDLAYA